VSVVGFSDHHASTSGRFAIDEPGDQRATFSRVVTLGIRL